MKRVLAVGVAMLAVVTFTACGGGGDEKADTTTTVEEATTTTEAVAFEPEKAKADITATYTKVFNDQTPLEESIKLIEEGESLRSALEAQRASGAAKGITPAIKSIQFQSETLADVNFDIALNGTVVAPNTKGQAKFIDGTWKVNKALFCTLLGLAGQTPPACAQS